MLLTGLFVLVATSARAGGVLVTSELAAFGSRGVSCSAVNAGSKDVELEIALQLSNGAVYDSVPTVTLAPGTSTTLRDVGSASVGLVHCRVAIHKGGKRAIRAAMCVHESLSPLTSPCIATAEAR